MKNTKKIILTLVIGICLASSAHMKATSSFVCKSLTSSAYEETTDINPNIILCHDDPNGNAGG